MDRMRPGWIARGLERGLVVLGTICLAWAAASYMRADAYQREQQAQLARVSSADERSRAAGGDVVPARSALPGPIGRLEMPRLGLSAVVMEGDDENTLNVAVGHLPDTPLPWQAGNAVLAGHRDTFFRPLRRVRIGDEIHLDTPRGTFRYRVTRRTVVEPDELWVLDPSPGAALTLITCYPFHFIGPAPRRLVVHAARAGPESGGTMAGHLLPAKVTGERIPRA